MECSWRDDMSEGGGSNPIPERATSRGDSPTGRDSPDTAGEIATPLTTNYSEIFNLIRAWLSTCLRNHKECRETISRTTISNDKAVRLPSRVLEVGARDNPTIRLRITNGEFDQYTALSYCWGSSPDATPVRTLQSNIESLKSSISISDLPKTIQHAITVTRELGIPYLWV